MSRDVESVDWVLETEAVMVDLVFVEGAVCTEVSFTWHVNPVVWANSWVVWGRKVRISEMRHLMVWGIVMDRVNWCDVHWCDVVWSVVVWSSMVRCVLNEMGKNSIC